MATIKADITLKFMSTKDGDMEEASFSAGDEVEIVETWTDYVLIKDDDGHLMNIAKDKLDT